MIWLPNAVIFFGTLIGFLVALRSMSQNLSEFSLMLSLSLFICIVSLRVIDTNFMIYGVSGAL